MPGTVTSFTKRTENVWIHVACAIGVTLFLFYIDEGYYNFEWMQEASNWVAFLIYATGLLFGQAIASVIILKNYKGKHKTLYSCLLGIPLGLTLLLTFFYYLKRD